MKQYLTSQGLQTLWNQIKALFVAKEAGKGLSSNDYTTAEKNKLSGLASGAEVNTIVAVQRNGTVITPKDRVVNILVPVKTSELNNDSTYQTAADVAETIVGVKLDLASGIITLTRKNGTTFTLDLPTEKIIKSGRYDNETKEIVLVFEDGSEIRFSASELIDEYYADESTLELYTDTADGNKKKFRIKTAYKNKIDGSEQTTNKTASVSSSSTSTQYPTALAVYNAVKDLATKVQTFTTANTRANIESGETIATIFGKIRKWLADLKTVAFTGSYNDLTNRPTIPTVGGGTITIKQKGVSKGSFTVNQSSNTTIELTDENTTYGIGNESTAGIVKSDANNVEILSSGKMVARKADLATFTDKGIKGIRIGRSSSSTNYVMLGAVGLDYNINSTFSLTVEVHGAYNGSGSDCNSRLSIYNIVFRLVNNSVAGQIGCVYASDSVNNAIVGEIVYPTATTDGMLYLWVNVSDISTQEAFNICVYGDTNKIDIRQSVRTTSIPYSSGVLLNPELHVNIATSATPGLVKSGGDITIASDGVVSVNDNSHNHTIANVTGLRNALDEKLSTTGLANYARRLSPVVNQRNSTTTRYLEICRATVSRSTNYVIYDASFIINGGDTTRAISMQARIMGWKGSNYQLDEVLLRVEQCSNGIAINRLCAEYVNPTADKDGLIIVYMDTESNNYWNYSIIPLGSPYDRFAFIQSNQVHLTQGVASLPANDGTVIKGSLKAMATHDGNGNNIAETYLKRSGGTVSGNLITPKGSYCVGLLDGLQDGVAGYVHFFSVKIIQQHMTEPFWLDVSSRDRIGRIHIYIQSGTGTTIETVSIAWESGSYRTSSTYCINPVWYKVTGDTIDLYWQKSQAYDYVSINNINMGLYARQHTEFTYKNALVTTTSGLTQVTERGTARQTLELTDSNIATYFNSSTGVLTIPNGVTTILFNTSSTKKVLNIIGGCAVNGYRLTIAGAWLPVQKTSSSTTGCFSSYIYGYRAGAVGTSFDGAASRLTEAFEDFIYFNGVWYSKAY